MPPERANLVLTSDIPYSERNVLVFDGLDIETFERREHLGQLKQAAVVHTNCWDSRDDLTKFQLVQNGSLTSSIQTDLETQDQTHFSRRKQSSRPLVSLLEKEETMIQRLPLIDK